MKNRKSEKIANKENNAKNLEKQTYKQTRRSNLIEIEKIAVNFLNSEGMNSDKVIIHSVVYFLIYFWTKV